MFILMLSFQLTTKIYLYTHLPVIILVDKYVDSQEDITGAFTIFVGRKSRNCADKFAVSSEK